VARAQACAHPVTRDSIVCARTGADGKYTIEAAATCIASMSRAHRARSSSAVGGRLGVRGQHVVLDARTNDASDVDFALEPGVVLRGTVRVGGATIEDAQVCLSTLAAPIGWQCERTDKHGAYSALRVPGDYWVWALPPDRVRAVGLWYDRVLGGVDASSFDLSHDAALDISLPSGPQIKGHVRNEAGEGVPDVLVCVDTPFTTGRICRPSGFDGSYA
jgi:hypothetical protein